MNTSLSALFDIYVFPTGRRIFALGQVATRAEAQSFPELAKHCAVALAHDRACLLSERRWEGAVAGTRGKARAQAGDAPDAASIDPLVDRTLTAIRDHAVSQTAGASPDDPLHAMVGSFLKTIFPTGVQDVTGLPFVEELEAVDSILGQLGKELAPTVKELGLGRLVKRLAELAVSYRAALQAPAAEVLAFGEVRATRIKGQELLLEAVAIVLGKHHGSKAADVAARDELLGPILEQNEAIAVAMRARRGTVADVNPETGTPDPAGTNGAPDDGTG